MQKLLVLLLVILAPSLAKSQGFYFENVPDTLHFYTNSSQSIAIYARNTSDMHLNFYPDYQHTGGKYGEFNVEDESFLDLTPAGALVKTVITYTPTWDDWYYGAAGKIYLHDTAWNKVDSVFFVGMRDTNRKSANALSAADTIDFGTVDLGLALSEKIVLRNSFTEPLTIDTMMLNGWGDMLSQYSANGLPAMPLTLAPNATDTLEITFTPDGSPAGGWIEFMINYHIGSTYQTHTVGLFGRTGKIAAGSADTLDLGPIPTFAFVGKKVTLKNNLSDSVEVYDYDPFAHFDLVVVMDSEGDSMVLGPHEEKEIIIFGLGMGFEGSEQKVQLQFTTHNGPLFHLGFVDVVVRTETMEEDIENPDRIFPLTSNSTVFIPYGTEIEVFGGGMAQFAETLQFENIEDHNVAVTELMLGDSLSTGYILTNFDSLPARLAPDEVITIEMDRYDSTIAAGWIVIVTDSTNIAGAMAEDLPPITVPKGNVQQNQRQQINISVVSLGDRKFEIRADVERATVTIYDLTGREISRGAVGMTWIAPSGGQAYLISLEGRKNGQQVRELRKIFVE